MKVRRWMALCAIVVAAMFVGAAARRQSLTAAPQAAAKVADNDGSLKLTLSVSPAPVPRGDSLLLHIEVQNVGAKDIFVCRSFDRWVPRQCVVELSITPLAMVQHQGLAGDCIPLEWRKKEDIKPVPFEKALRDAWISLPPGASYDVEVELKSGMYPELDLPGQYKIVATIYSTGFAVKDCYSMMEFHKDEIAALNEPVWTGSLSSEVGFVVKQQ